MRLLLVRNPRARRYVMRLRGDGSARVAVPRNGSVEAARQFAEANIPWLERQIERQARRLLAPQTWKAGDQILFRGELLRLETTQECGMWVVQFAGERLPLRSPQDDLRPHIQRHLWRLAARELPRRVAELGALHGVAIGRVTIRNQRSRWGSCSRRGTVSLNWRLLQAPDFVRDYIILHELAHLREMNHSDRFWAEVKRLCPELESAERWLKQHSNLLR